MEPLRPGLWRYRPALPPLPPESLISLGEGMTPLVAARIGGLPLLLKCDYCNPTGSWKDRGWAVALSHLKRLGVAAVVEDSSGNAGASLAAYGARARIRVTVYVPDDSPGMKRRQIEAHGARVVEVSGGRDAAAAACLDAAREVFYAGHAWNPWFLTGSRTLAWEIVEQCGGKAPDVIFLPVGQGGLLLGLAHGFSAQVAAGILRRPPRLVATQAAACAPIVAGLGGGHAEPPPVAASPTLADAIRTPRPVRYREVVAAIRATDGDAIAVEEDEIQRAWKALGRNGFFVEPTSAVAAAGALRWLAAAADVSVPTGVSSPTALVVLTGHGLKSDRP
jgi:threonine synthase